MTSTLTEYLAARFEAGHSSVVGGQVGAVALDIVPLRTER